MTVRSRRRSRIVFLASESKNGAFRAGLEPDSGWVGIEGGGGKRQSHGASGALTYSHGLAVIVGRAR